MVGKKTNKKIKKLIVWALFDDGNCSYKKAIQKYFDGKFIVHCFGINEDAFEDGKNYHYHKLNLSLTNYIEIKNKLDKLQKPDIILASPPCESWSTADCGGRMVLSIGNKNKCYWNIQNYDYFEKYCNECHPVKRRHFIKKRNIKNKWWKYHWCNNWNY